MSRLMVIGCGGVASVAVHKCCQNSGVFTELMIASRTKSKCDALKAQLEGKTDTPPHPITINLLICYFPPLLTGPPHILAA